MDSLGFYFHEHPLEHVNRKSYGISQYCDLGENPPVKYTFKRNDIQIPIFDTTRIIGTVIAKDDIRSQISLLTVESGVVIDGRFKYNEDAKLNISKDATVPRVEAYKNVSVNVDTEKSLGQVIVARILDTLFSFLNLLVVGLLMILLFPRLFKKIKEIESNKILPDIAWGLLVLIAAPIAAVLLMFTMVGLSTALGKLLETKVSAISQINSSISKANDLDYKREKDRKSIEANQGMDDKRLMDLYQSFVANPMGIENNVMSLGPTAMQTSIGNSPIIRSDVPDYTPPANGPADIGYLNYLSNMTPEQNLMFYENNPNVQTCVIYDASTGNKFFQVMDVSTGQAVPNVQALDNRFMEDTFIDLKSKTASNNNLHQTYPVIVINEGVASQY
jgi:hypothetical protein